MSFPRSSTKSHFSRRPVEDPSREKAAGGADATVHRRVSCHLSRGQVFFLSSRILLLICCAHFKLGARYLPMGDLWWPGSGLKGRLVCFGFHLML